MEVSQLKIQISNLQILFWVCCVAGMVFGILTIILFIKFRIPELIEELTGVSAKRAIRRYSEMNEKTVKYTGFKVFETLDNKLLNEQIEDEEETQILEMTEDYEMHTLVLEEK